MNEHDDVDPLEYLSFLWSWTLNALENDLPISDHEAELYMERLKPVIEMTVPCTRH